MHDRRIALEVPAAPAVEMVPVPGGSFLMGSNDFYPEERPVHREAVEGFWMDSHPVTVAEFRSFVAATGYITVAERSPDPARYPGVERSLLVPGSLVFRKPPRRVALHDIRQWWRYIPGACWHRPEGPGSSITGREHHPVTHVAYEDATSYARWAGKELPSEAEWERAARGGIEGAAFVWGDEPAPNGRMMANTWQGEFPWQNLATDGYEGTSPVAAFPPNRYGLYDMAGNVWEWTRDAFKPSHHHAPGPAGQACCAPRHSRIVGADPSQSAPAPVAHASRRVLKGGSHLCAPNYCLRYRPAARQPQDEDSSASHIGFRCIVRDHATPSDPSGARH
jgi:formylglycine-generating enzyme required for sulfatase activity